MNSPGFPTGADRAIGPESIPQEAETQEAPPSDAACASQVGSDPGSEIPHRSEQVVQVDAEQDRRPDPDVVVGTGSRYAWGRRNEEIVIWRMKPEWRVIESFSPHHLLEALQLFLALERRGRLGGRTRAWMAGMTYEARSTLAARMRQFADRMPQRAYPAHPARVWAGILVVAFLGFVISVTLLRSIAGEVSREGALPQEQSDVNAVDPGTAMPSRPRESATSPDSLPGVNLHVNDQAGYLFSYPDSWDLYTSGETDDLVSPGEDIKVSFGVAPPGPLRQASNGVLGRLTDAYSNVELVSDRVERTEQGQRGLVTGATATDANGAFVRLMAIIIRGPDQNRSITIRFSASSNPLHALSAIRQIVASFRTSVTA